jgi:hypothetical protein
VNRLLSSVLTVLFAAGCATSAAGPHATRLMNFSDVDQNLDKSISVSGFISQTHGAAGLYFRRSDLVEENSKCILPRPFDGYLHGEEVTMSGRLQRTDCGAGLIFLNACDKYVLIRSSGE